jgi:RNA polymerase sigma factor (sigma-70 family)
MSHAASQKPERLSQESLRALARKEDRAALLRGLVEQHGEALLRYCELLLRDVHSAADVLQSVFVESLEDLAQFEGKSSIRVWLFQIARHRCLDALKSSRRWAKVVEPADEAAQSVPDGSTAELTLQENEGMNALRDCIESLPPASRDVVLLRLREDMTYQELSQITGESSGALRVRFTRALPVLRRCLESRGVAP